MTVKGECSRCGRPVAHYEGCYAHIHRRAMRDGNPKLHETRTTVFSATLCPRCGREFARMCGKWTEGRL